MQKHNTLSFDIKSLLRKKKSKIKNDFRLIKTIILLSFNLITPGKSKQKALEMLIPIGLKTLTLFISEKTFIINTIFFLIVLEGLKYEFKIIL